VDDEQPIQKLLSYPLQKEGYDVVPATIDISPRFVVDFVDYWGMLAATVALSGRLAFGRTFSVAALDPFTRGLIGHYKRVAPRTPAFLRRLARVRHDYAALFTRHDVLLSPVLAHVTPELGWLRPTVPFEQLLRRLIDYVAFTPLNNVAGAPAMSLPVGTSTNGLPVGVHLSVAHGDERTLLELAYALEADRPWRRIQDA